MKILIVDDEQDLREILQYNLETEGYEVHVAASAEEAWPVLTGARPPYDLLLLDVMMGEMSGFTLAQKLRQHAVTARLPIIFITALDGEDNAVRGLNIGADDYMTKPLSMREVKARVNAVLRRTKQPTDQATRQTDGQTYITYEGLTIDTERKTATIDGQDTPLTKIEYELLRLLVSHTGHVFTREELLHRCWPEDSYVLDRTVDVNITRLRKKIGPYGTAIRTRFGFGYTFEP